MASMEGRAEETGPAEGGGVAASSSAAAVAVATRILTGVTSSRDYLTPTLSRSKDSPRKAGQVSIS